MDVPSHLPSKSVNIRFILRRCELLSLCDPTATVRIAHITGAAHHGLVYSGTLQCFYRTFGLTNKDTTRLSPKSRLPKLVQLIKNNTG